ncbi:MULTISPECIES: hypothetical protein [Burkholderia cepacia complex]|uniref:Uncharacterized protein n=1 Tax=Burkholderia ubonensis TaxID=101571 RepID=A0A1R1J803_9BURK|nr:MULTISPECIES: hypothetical protein [Burkholderia cepacia complex]KVR69142.1 hypothetical protein WK24_12755 [Burkholderia vietnamiensis]MCA8447951.1 hypothetical protein [Burkholderia vietnamiensis]MDN7669646.1 hypothetical protein [Burkholderia vietnamiensis]OMG71455.1 hypothetical protein BW685_20990 [Burkholderia ubonensis]HDR8955202.1 hypothetical protein [Burkholderia vietnamiensis]
MLTDDSDDELLLPGDVLASAEEIYQAVIDARSDSHINARLLAAARFILTSTSKVKRTGEPEDLLQDAIEAVLSGRRKWPKSRVDFKGLLVGVMRSIAWSRDNTLMKTTPDLTMEHELPLVGEAQEPQSLDDVAADPETTEEKVLRHEQHALEETKLAILRANYGPDALHGKILDKVREGFASHLEVREALGIEDSAYWNAWKALMRAAEKLNSNAKE